jgi:transcription elongation factor Elf1
MKPTKTVFLIASGYEWTCPHCNKLNKVVAVPKPNRKTNEVTVRCGKCKRIYGLEDYFHAID